MVILIRRHAPEVRIDMIQKNPSATRVYINDLCAKACEHATAAVNHEDAEMQLVYLSQAMHFIECADMRIRQTTKPRG